MPFVMGSDGKLITTKDVKTIDNGLCVGPNPRTSQGTLSSPSDHVHYTGGQPLRTIKFDAKGAIEMEIWGAVDAVLDGSGDVDIPNTTWKLLGKHKDTEPRVTYLDPSLAEKLFSYAYVRVRKLGGDEVIVTPLSA